MLGIAVVVVALILVSVTVALTNPRGGDTFSEDTPEGVLQRFILAIQDQDYSLAHRYLSDELQKSCTVEHMRIATRWFIDGSRNRRIALLEKEMLSDDRARVRVCVTEVNVSPPFGVEERSHQEGYVLVQEGGEWHFAEPPWPVGWYPDPEEELPEAPRIGP